MLRALHARLPRCWSRASSSQKKGDRPTHERRRRRKQRAHGTGSTVVPSPTHPASICTHRLCSPLHSSPSSLSAAWSCVTAERSTAESAWWARRTTTADRAPTHPSQQPHAHMRAHTRAPFVWLVWSSSGVCCRPKWACEKRLTADCSAAAADAAVPSSRPRRSDTRAEH